MAEKEYKVLTPWFQPYSKVRELIVILDGVSKTSVINMRKAIFDQVGTPQNPVDWTEPDIWIPERLSGEDANLALRIWSESNHMVNPRHISGSYRLINTYELLVPDNIGVYRLSERGNAFLNEDPKAVQEIDEAEGLTKLLEILAIKTRSKRADLLPEWGDYLRKFSKLGTDSTIKSTLLNRLINLAERGLVKRDGIYYSITPSGIELVNKSPIREIEPMRNVLRSISAFNNDQRSALRENLEKMHPYRFEQLIRDLLEAMGYDDVQVTRATGDKGVDVVATVQFGITTITEVVQVKRQQGNIGREILDQLRGALPYHKAIRGTIITIGDFTKKCKEAALFPGAAPIGLIDGDRLLDLLFEHEIGIKERPATLYELDLDCFSETISSEEIINGTEDADENLGN